jgi:hypothetical protein
MSERVAQTPVAGSAVGWAFAAGRLVKRRQALSARRL